MSEKGKSRIRGVQAFSLILQLGLNMMVPIVLCFLLGNFIYKKTGAAWPLAILIIAGIAAAFNSCWRLIKKMFLSDDKDTEKN